ncbi:hypothetical protein GGI43DRAFT_56031 [Trichoderma evansii]
MNARHHRGRAKKACTRCSIQKRRCDRAIPECGLCQRLGQICKYEVSSSVSSSAPTPLSSSKVEILMPETFGPSHVKDAIMQRLGSITPDSVFSKYAQSIEPWFPIISHRLQSQLPSSWTDASLDFTLLGLCIVMLSANPPPSSEVGSRPSEFKSWYLCSKSCIALIEGLGINSIEIVLARLFVSLFEVAHGFYPAAYISIGATARAADALAAHSGIFASPFHSSNNKAERQETILIWCGICILERYISVESGLRPSLTDPLTDNVQNVLKDTFHLAHLEQDPTSLMCRLCRLFDASMLLDKIRTAISNHAAERPFHMEEIMLTVDTSSKLQSIIMGELGDLEEVYSGGLGLCNIGLLLAYDNGSKVPLTDSVTSTCNSIATTSLDALLVNVTSTVEPFVVGIQTLHFNRLPPFITFLVYKAAALVTSKLCVDIDWNDGLRKLRILRGFLRMASARWLACERYLELLNEDTTPRILKSVEQG